MNVLLPLEHRALSAPARPPVPPRWRIGAAALVSVALHVALIGLAVYWMRRSAPVVGAIETPATVQVVMTPPAATPRPPPPPDTPRAPEATPKPPSPSTPPPETPAPPKPAQAAEAAPKAPPATPPKPETPPQTPQTAAAAPQAPPTTAPQSKTPPTPETPQATESTPEPPPAPPRTAEAAPEVPPPAPTTSKARQPRTEAPPVPAPAAPKATDDKLAFDFSGVEGEGNAFMTGSFVVPPSPDVKYHNRKPYYPEEAALRGEQGAVVMTIHVTPDGLVSSVDIVESSGHPALDRAARDAVLTWHFLPSVKDGQPVPANVPVRFDFVLD